LPCTKTSRAIIVFGDLVCPFKTSGNKGKKLGRTVEEIQLFAWLSFTTTTTKLYFVVK